jgi:hypothetical protein
MMAGPVSACRIRPASLETPGRVLLTDSGSHPFFRAPCYLAIAMFTKLTFHEIHSLGSVTLQDHVTTALRFDVLPGVAVAVVVLMARSALKKSKKQ